MVSIFALSASPGNAVEPSSFAIYDDDPDHLWNRLHRTLFGRGGDHESAFGLDDTQLLYWGGTKHLTEGESYDTAIAVLDAQKNE